MSHLCSSKSNEKSHSLLFQYLYDEHKTKESIQLNNILFLLNNFFARNILEGQRNILEGKDYNLFEQLYSKRS